MFNFLFFKYSRCLMLIPVVLCASGNDMYMLEFLRRRKRVLLFSDWWSACYMRVWSWLLRNFLRPDIFMRILILFRIVSVRCQYPRKATDATRRSEVHQKWTRHQQKIQLIAHLDSLAYLMLAIAECFSLLSMSSWPLMSGILRWALKTLYRI